ncbi:MAG: TrmB family transcriptional regulator [Candidatus Thorarchaeota archaeon]
MKALEELGLTSYEAKTYHALLSAGISDAKEICSQSGVPWGRIYDVLATLERKGLVESQSSRPKQFIPVEPRIALETLLELKSREIELLKETAARIESELNDLYRVPQEESMFWNVALGAEMEKKALERMVEAKKELLLYTELQKFKIPSSERLTEYRNLLQGLVNSGIKIRFLFAMEAQEIPDKFMRFFAAFADLQEKIQTRITPKISSCFDIIDGEKVILKVPNPIDPREYFAAIYVWQKPFAEELKAKFDELWMNAKQLQIGLE